MVRKIDRDEVRRLLEKGAQLVEVLPRPEYELIHISGARSIPLKQLARGAAELDRDRPVIVYCNDQQ